MLSPEDVDSVVFTKMLQDAESAEHSAMADALLRESELGKEWLAVSELPCAWTAPMATDSRFELSADGKSVRLRPLKLTLSVTGEHAAMFAALVQGYNWDSPSASAAVLQETSETAEPHEQPLAVAAPLLWAGLAGVREDACVWLEDRQRLLLLLVWNSMDASASKTPQVPCSWAATSVPHARMPLTDVNTAFCNMFGLSLPLDVGADDVDGDAAAQARAVAAFARSDPYVQVHASAWGNGDAWQGGALSPHPVVMRITRLEHSATFYMLVPCVAAGFIVGFKGEGLEQLRTHGRVHAFMEPPARVSGQTVQRLLLHPLASAPKDAELYPHMLTVAAMVWQRLALLRDRKYPVQFPC